MQCSVLLELILNVKRLQLPDPQHSNLSGTGGVTRSDGAWGGKKQVWHPPVFEPDVFPKQMQCRRRKYLRHFWDFLPPPAVIRRPPRRFGAPVVNCAPLALCVTPLSGCM